MEVWARSVVTTAANATQTLADRRRVENVPAGGWVIYGALPHAFTFVVASHDPRFN